MSAWLSAKEAAALAGVSKSAILKAIHTGRLSAERDRSNAYRVQVVELERAFGVSAASAPSAHQVGDLPHQVGDVPQLVSAPAIEVLQATNDQLVARLREKDDVIADLRQRLDAEAEERRRLSLLLTDKEQPRQPAARSWWARLVGRGE